MYVYIENRRRDHHWLILATTVILLASCSNNRGGDRNWPIDNGDAHTDAVKDVRTDAEPFRCEDAPTARLSASIPEIGKDTDAGQRRTIAATPLSSIGLNSEASRTRDGRSIDRVEWKIQRRPEFAVATFGVRRLRRGNQVPLFMTSKDPDPNLQVGLTGEYEITLDVWNDEGVRSCNTAELVVTVRPESDLYVEFKYPYQRVEAEEEDGTLYKYAATTDKPQFIFSFKRTADAGWNEDLNDVIPNTRAQIDVQDWGMRGESYDDPDWVDVYNEGPTTSFLRLNGVESDVPYFAAASVCCTGNPEAQSPAISKVYVDGERRFKNRRLFGKDYEVAFGLEFLRIEKTDNSFDIQSISNLYYNN